MVAASPMRKNIKPMVTTSCTTSGASTNRRMRTRSMSAPNSGATISTTNTSATHAGQPWLIRTSQYRKAMIIPMAPCAKLNTPDVV